MTVGAVIVSWDDAAATARAVESLAAQSVPLSEIVVIDNHPDHPALRSSPVTSRARVVPSPVNRGFAGGAALGLRETAAEWILVMNPDAAAASDCVERLLDAAAPRTGLVGAQILLPDGRTNAGDNPVHLSGITWAGRFGEPRESGPPRAVASVSGAAMLIRRAAYEQIGGFTEEYFLYHEDVDLSWRMRLAGWDVVFQPAAHVEHDYAFDKGPEKWFWLERNRLRTVLACYSGRALLILAPLLLATEVAVTVRARRDGWSGQKRRAVAEVWRERSALRARRRRVQGTRRASDGTLLVLMVAGFDAAAVDAPAVRRLTPLLSVYRRSAMRLLG